MSGAEKRALSTDLEAGEGGLHDNGLRGDVVGKTLRILRDAHTDDSPKQYPRQDGAGKRPHGLNHAEVGKVWSGQVRSWGTQVQASVEDL